MKYRVIFRAEARDEAVEAAGYIAEQGYPETALTWYEALEAAIDSLATLPARCPFAREYDAFPDLELRQLVFKSHRLIFVIRGDEVHVLHVRHVARANIDDPRFKISVGLQQAGRGELIEGEAALAKRRKKRSTRHRRRDMRRQLRIKKP